VLPIVFEGQVKGVLELASFEGFSSTHQAFLEQLTESIGIVINTIESNTRTEDLLTQSQSLAQELQSRQIELQQTNQELQDKAGQLAHQNQEVERKNEEVEQARQALEEKARQLALTSKYKSEFLANMSHELRTPLNSLLILSDQLSGNAEGNLSGRQIEFAKTIHSSGNDLLMLINDILDLSKIESGTVAVDVGELPIDELNRYVERTFRPVAESRKLDFMIRLDQHLPPAMFTDTKRLQQIIKNLLSNAFKFTHRGQVTLAIEPAAGGWSADNEALNRAPQALAFSVTDTGIGIPGEKQQIIFEAFQQADGSTSRKYGGTGLGLAISRELSRLLGGEIRLSSTPGRGSTFTLYLPQNYSPPVQRWGEAPAPQATPVPSPEARIAADKAVPAIAQPPAEPEPAALINEAEDDRASVRPGDLVLLVVENDISFAKVLLEAARAKGLKGLVSTQGAGALALAKEFKPSAVTLDIHLPDIEGWRVLERLKNDVATRHVPVCVISTEEARERAWRAGAWSFLAKPIQSADRIAGLVDEVKEVIQRKSAEVLVLAPRESDLLRSLRSFDGAVSLKHVTTAKAALKVMAKEKVSCLVCAAQSIDPAELPEKTADDLVEGRLPMIVYDSENLIHDDDAKWHRLLKGGRVRLVRSPERFVDQLAFMLHLKTARLPEAHRQVLQRMYQSNKLLEGKRALIVDDDMRNIFALSSVLEEYRMEIRSTDNGRDAINMLDRDPAVDIVLMDIMMPEMDGLETMREIRKIPACRDLPIIAVTAKAMKGDRERCLEAGAWDYLSKPVDTEQLLGTLRAWLHR
jgi:signal transduction histidine kinase/DNA-binding response OmpR family regulator